ncbi:MAG: lipopolysaccharide heptosyltransferase II [Candidatus Omnitrophica bacterium]|jgi:lipopolysaccharide heptosyltransferase II|nr:lipopolysaccharide heptosyltransferase II [Candidatus Omnitrophota bacterium]
MKNILIVNPFGIGDVLFTTGLARNLRSGFPDSRITYWCNQRVKEILELNPNIDDIIACSRGDLKKIFHASFLNGIKSLFSLCRLIRKKHFECVFDFSLDYRYSLLLKMLGVPKRIGFDYKNRGRFLTDKIKIQGYDALHAAEWYAQLLKFVGVKPDDNHLDLFVNDEDTKVAKKLISNAAKAPLAAIAVSSGASWGKRAYLKQWPEENFAELIDRLVSGLKAEVVLIGDVSEEKVAERIEKLLSNPVVNLCGKTTLRQLAAVINLSRAVIATDGGILHMARALNIPAVSIFGPVDERVYGPYPASEKYRVVKAQVPCRPCYRDFRIEDCQHNLKCLTNIKPDEVFENLRRIW